MIANACFSDQTSNGRTLKGLFGGAEPEQLAQFFVYGDPDFNICRRYYQVSDREALASLNPFGTYGGPVGAGGGFGAAEAGTDRPLGEADSGAGRKKGDGREVGGTETAPMGVAHKTPMKMLAREAVWLLGRWKGHRLREWIEGFRPERLCLFLANNTFLIRLAVEIGQRYRIPLLVYSTEGYCFMDYNYFTNRPSVLYKLYYGWLYGSYRRSARFVSEGFFNCTLLRDRYAEAFGYPCRCVMNGSEIDFVDRRTPEGTPVVSYLGNLGLGRHRALMEIARALQETDPKLYLDIYGAAPDEEARGELEACPGVRFHGFVSYGEVVRIIHESSLLVHAEWNDERVNRDLKYAFSTKIADSLCSGTPLLIYANEGLAETVFLKENGCAFVVHERDRLKAALEQALTDWEMRGRVIDRAMAVQERYFRGNGEFMRALT